MPRSMIYQGVVPPYGGLGVLRKKLTIGLMTNNTSIDMFALPAYASVIGGGVHILTAFNDSGTDTLDVGFRGGSATDDPDGYATLLLVSAVGYIALDELATTTNIISTKPLIVTARYAGQNSNGTAGVAYLTVLYSVGPSDGS